MPGSPVSIVLARKAEGCFQIHSGSFLRIVETARASKKEEQWLFHPMPCFQWCRKSMFGFKTGSCHAAQAGFKPFISQAQLPMLNSQGGATIPGQKFFSNLSGSWSFSVFETAIAIITVLRFTQKSPNILDDFGV